MADNLLLVDESPLIHRVVELTFEGHDVSVYSADDAEEAMALARSLKPDIVIASTQIKRGNGLEFCRELRGDAELAKIPVLLLASAKDNLSEEEAHEAGAVGVLTKPFKPESLLSEVGVALRWESSSAAEEPAAADEPDSPDAPSGIPDEGTGDPDAFLGELEASAPEETTGSDIGDQAPQDDSDALPGLPDDQEALLDNAENLLGEAEAQFDPDDTEEKKPSQAVSDPPPMGKDMSTETPSGPSGESSSHEEEDIFGDTDIEDLFDEYDAESGSSGAPSSAPTPESGEGAEDKIQAGKERGAPSDGDLADGNLDHTKNTKLSDKDDDLASLQAELSADLEEIEGSHFHEDRVRAAEDELASLEAELAMDEETPSGAETSPEPPSGSKDLELAQGRADIKMPSTDEETDLKDDLDDTFFQDGESGLRDKLADETASPPPHESPEIYAIPHEDKPQEESGDDDLAAMLDNTDFGPELDMPFETPAGEEIPGMEGPSGEEGFGPDALLETELTSPPMGDAESEGKDESREPGLPDKSDQDESALEPLVEQSLEKTVEAIVPAILHRIESIIVERLPGIVEKIVLREIEKIKRGE